MTSKILFGLGGLVIGAVAGVFGSKTFWKTKYETLYEENKELLYARTEGDWHTEKGEEDTSFKIVVQNDEQVPDDLTEEEKAERKRRLKENFKRTTDYAEMYRKRNLEAESRDDQNDVPEWTDESINKYHEEHKDDGPEVISKEILDGLPPSIEVRDIDLYFYDDTLIDPAEESEVEDPETIFGECLNNFYQNDEDEIIVLNQSLDSCYVVHKIMNSWYNPNPDLEV